jgi:hypothetical protein
MSAACPVNLEPSDVSRARAYVLLRVKVVDQERGCWEWQQNRLHGGHGQAKWRGYPIKAHRLAYAAFRGEPGEMGVLHECDNPGCCNPAHHFLGTKADNNRDAHKKGRYAKRQERLTREQFDEIVNGIICGEAQIPLAHRVGVDAYHVNWISTGKHWACQEYGAGLPWPLVEDGRAAFNVSASNTSGFRGVSPTKGGRWQAQAWVNNVCHSFGSHETAEAARDARAAGMAALKLPDEAMTFDMAAEE